MSDCPRPPAAPSAGLFPLPGTAPPTEAGALAPSRRSSRTSAGPARPPASPGHSSPMTPPMPGAPRCTAASGSGPYCPPGQTCGAGAVGAGRGLRALSSGHTRRVRGQRAVAPGRSGQGWGLSSPAPPPPQQHLRRRGPWPRSRVLGCGLAAKATDHVRLGDLPHRLSVSGLPAPPGPVTAEPSRQDRT